MKDFTRQIMIAISTFLLMSAPTLAWDKYPETTDDGLERIESKKVDAVYWKEGATLADYDRVRIDNIEVSFRKNWQRDQNRARRGASERVTTSDMDKIREALADLFREEFTKELEDGGYQVVDEKGPDVLLLVPAIVDLDVTAPDLSMRQPGMTHTYTTSAGEMTLNLELRDSETNALIGRAIDRRKEQATTRIQYTNRITNRAEASRILGRWARLLREALDDAHQEH